MDHDTLYETDICTWAERQVAVLRGLASRVDLPNELDLDNVVEEIEDVGNSQLRSVRSFMRLMLSHLILIAVDADADSVGHWTREVATFRGELMLCWQRSMRQRIDMDVIWRHAVEEAGLKLSTYRDEYDLGLLGSANPFGVEDLCGESFDFHGMTRQLSGLVGGM
jgi:hypothetical protein